MAQIDGIKLLTLTVACNVRQTKGKKHTHTHIYWVTISIFLARPSITLAQPYLTKWQTFEETILKVISILFSVIAFKCLYCIVKDWFRLAAYNLLGGLKCYIAWRSSVEQWKDQQSRIENSSIRFACECEFRSHEFNWSIIRKLKIQWETDQNKNNFIIHS